MDAIPSKQELELLALFAQQDILNQIIRNYNLNVNLNKEAIKHPNIEAITSLMKSVVDDINNKQLIIDANIKQLQNDIRARLN